MIKKISKYFFKRVFLLTLITILCLGFSSCNKKHKEPEINLNEVNPKNASYYQVFVRSFADSNDDGIGDFNGVTAKLNYLYDLGIRGIWLMPVYPSPTYHGYDITDYYDVNSDYGSLDDLKNLISKAHELGISVILDMAFNHTSSEHEWFKKALANDPVYKDYYVFTTENTNGKVGSWGQNIWHMKSGKKYCGYFSDTMPDLNFKNEAVKAEILKITKFWIDQGVDGFRLDAAAHFYGLNEYLDTAYNYVDNVVYLKSYQKSVEEMDKDFYLMGEINDSYANIISYYYLGIDSPLDFPISDRLIATANTYNARGYVSGLTTIYKEYKSKDVNFISAPFLANHDEDRIATQLSGNMAKMKYAAELLLCLPGNPVIYYGEETGMFGWKASGPNIWDETRRTSINWGDQYTTTWLNKTSDTTLQQVTIANASVKTVKNQLEDATSLLNLYKTLLNLRENNMALKYGNSFTAYEGNTNTLQGYYREYQYESLQQKVLIIHNTSSKAVSLNNIEGKVLYLSGNSNPTSISEIPALSTIIIDVTGK